MTRLNTEDQEELALDIAEAVTRVVNERGVAAGLQSLTWTMSSVDETEFEGSHPLGPEHADAAAVCGAWAYFLGLGSAFGANEGFQTWSGQLGDLRLILFAITDANRYAGAYPDVSA
ncbi:hypothetical protein B7495_06075 [Cryobacterium sp. LW097]|uniref:hypothetical protein n=1 Tax=Cryobacterium sp. LW097 TaxID=1978566 RepID=UPI000B4DC2E3|nr:hypothetical protein [Cryobacterium sp. LW097]ASD21714.1 hypothetical protein B7495_06075 [Cryobacterium sp. LW097]